MDYACRESAGKMGEQRHRLSLDETQIAIEEQTDLIISLDQALDRLDEMSVRFQQVVELRYFGGLIEDDTARVRGVSIRTVQRDWSKANARLYKELYPDRV